MKFWIGCVVVAFVLLLTVPAFAQKDRMSLGESFGAQIIKAPAPAGDKVSPKPKADELAPKEDLEAVKSPAVPKATP